MQNFILSKMEPSKYVGYIAWIYEIMYSGERPGRGTYFSLSHNIRGKRQPMKLIDGRYRTVIRVVLLHTVPNQFVEFVTIRCDGTQLEWLQKQTEQNYGEQFFNGHQSQQLCITSNFNCNVPLNTSCRGAMVGQEVSLCLSLVALMEQLAGHCQKQDTGIDVPLT